jgi:hypothetical protein
MLACLTVEFGIGVPGIQRERWVPLAVKPFALGLIVRGGPSGRVIRA